MGGYSLKHTAGFSCIGYETLKEFIYIWLLYQEIHDQDNYTICVHGKDYFIK